MLGRLPSSGICSKQLIVLDPFRKRLCRHVFPQWTTGDGGTLPEEPAAFGIRWLERSPFSVFKTKSLFNICCREFSWLRVPRETVLFLLFPVSLLIKVILLPFPHLLCLHMCFLLDRHGEGSFFPPNLMVFLSLEVSRYQQHDIRFCSQQGEHTPDNLARSAYTHKIAWREDFLTKLLVYCYFSAEWMRCFK